MKTFALTLTTALVAANFALTDDHAPTYGPLLISLKGYEGDKTNSVSYSGQVARPACGRFGFARSAAGQCNLTIKEDEIKT